MRKGYVASVAVILLFGLVCSVNAFSVNLWEPENPLVVEIANELIGIDDFETAKNIWNWVSENILYEEFTVNKVEITLQSGIGNCTSQSFLAASLLLAGGWEIENVRIGTGKSHMWVEICTDRWHRFDTVYTQIHSFEHEYSLEIPQEGLDNPKITYYYYEKPKNGANIVLSSVEERILKNIHEIKLFITNSGDVGKNVDIQILETDCIIVGVRESVYIEAGQTVQVQLYFQGEGKVRIQIEREFYETYLSYPVNEIYDIVQLNREVLKPDNIAVEISQPEKIDKNTVIKKIVLDSGKGQIEAEETSGNNFSPLVLILPCFLVFPCFLLFKRRKK